MPFLPGQSGNPNGRPRKPDLRSKITEEFIEQHEKDIIKVLKITLSEAKKRKPWAIKECISLFTTKPTTNISVASTELSEKRLVVKHMYKELSWEDKTQIYDVLMRKKPKVVETEVEVEAEVIE